MAKKKSGMVGMVVGGLVLLGAILAGVYYVATKKKD